MCTIYQVRSITVLKEGQGGARLLSANELGTKTFRKIRTERL